MIEQH